MESRLLFRYMGVTLPSFRFVGVTSPFSVLWGSRLFFHYMEVTFPSFRFVRVTSPFLRFVGVTSPFRFLESRLHFRVFFLFFGYFINFFFHLVPVVQFPRLNGGVLLGPLPIVTSLPLVRVPNPLACAYS